MAWLLLTIVLNSGTIYIHPHSIYESAGDCMDVRNQILETATKPKVNYEAVCIRTDNFQGI